MAVIKGKSPKILYFLEEANPSAHDLEIANAIEAQVIFINGSYMQSDDIIDKNTCGYVGVAGFVPANWLAAFGEAVDAAEHAEMLAKRNPPDKGVTN